MASSNTPEKTTKHSANERFVSLADEDVERFVEAKANKDTQLVFFSISHLFATLTREISC